MRRLINYFILIFLLLVMSVNVVSAQSIKVSCPDKAKPGSSFTCSITASYSKSYGGVEAVPSFSSGLKLGDFTRGTSFSMGDLHTKLSVISDDEIIGNSSVGKFTVIMSSDVNKSQTINFTNVKIMEIDGDDVKSIGCSDVIVTINIDNTVEEKPKEEKPKEEDKPSNGSSNNKPSTGSSNSRPSGGNGTTNDKIVSTKISSIKLSSGEIKFNKDVNLYEIKVDNQVTKIDVEIELEDKESTVSVTGNTNLQVGINTISITVIGRDGSNNVYTIKVTRLDGDSLLSSLNIKGYKIDFDSNEFNYSIELKDKGSSLEIQAIPVSDKATVLIEGNNDLDVGSEVEVIVKAQDGSTSIYKIKIISLVTMKLVYGLIGAFAVTLLISIITILVRNKYNR